MLGYNQAKVLIRSKSTFLGIFHLYHFCLPITTHHSTKFEKKLLNVIPSYKVAKFWIQIGPKYSIFPHIKTFEDISLMPSYLPINPYHATKYPKNLYSEF